MIMSNDWVEEEKGQSNAMMFRYNERCVFVQNILNNDPRNRDYLATKKIHKVLQHATANLAFVTLCSTHQPSICIHIQCHVLQFDFTSRKLTLHVDIPRIQRNVNSWMNELNLRRRCAAAWSCATLESRVWTVVLTSPSPRLSSGVGSVTSLVIGYGCSSDGTHV